MSKKITTPEKIINLWGDDIKKIMEERRKNFYREILKGWVGINEQEDNQG